MPFRCRGCGKLYWRDPPLPAHGYHEAEKFVCQNCGTIMISITRLYQFGHFPRTATTVPALDLQVIGHVGEMLASSKEAGGATPSRNEAQERGGNAIVLKPTLHQVTSALTAMLQSQPRTQRTARGAGRHLPQARTTLPL